MLTISLGSAAVQALVASVVAFTMLGPRLRKSNSSIAQEGRHEEG